MKEFFQLSDGTQIPAIGFGTWRLEEGEEAYQSVAYALEVGYRHIDTAQMYGNEASVGRAIKDSGLARAEVYVTTKLNNNIRGYEETLAAVEDSLEKLQMPYIDLLLIHWPNPWFVRQNGEEQWKKANAETWRALETLVQSGKIKSLGVSNFFPHHIEELLKTATIKPVINQIRIAPGCMPTEIIEYCRQKDIELEAYSPLGSGALFENETVQAMAEKYDCTPAQIALRWVLDRGYLPLPRSKSPKNIASNLNLATIELSEADRQILDVLEGMGEQTNPDVTTF